MSQPTIVFDLDGTLVDSAPDLVSALNTLLAREGLGPLPVDQARNYVGRGGRVLIRHGLQAHGTDVSDARLEEMFSAYLAIYEADICAATRPYPGAIAALDLLASRGHRFAICTNKYQKAARMLLAELGLTERFGAIVGADTFPVSKPNGAVLRLTVEKAGGDPARAIMVGDTKTDVDTARDAGLPVVGVDFGYAPEPMAQLRPDRLISHFDALPGAVAELCDSLPQAA